MRVVWTEFAKGQLRQTAKYINDSFGVNVKSNFLQEIRSANKLLAENPYAGKYEPLLTGRTVKYRSYVANRYNKIVYRVDNNRVEVVAFWDTRQEPTRLAKQI